MLKLYLAVVASQLHTHMLLYLHTFFFTSCFPVEIGIFERFRGILHEGEIDKRVQFLIEGLFALRKSKFQVHFHCLDLLLFSFYVLLLIVFWIVSALVKQRILNSSCNYFIQGYPAVRPELDLVEQEDQLTHEISLSDEIDPEIALGNCSIHFSFCLVLTFILA